MLVLPGQRDDKFALDSDLEVEEEFFDMGNQRDNNWWRNSFNPE